MGVEHYIQSKRKEILARIFRDIYNVEENSELNFELSILCTREERIEHLEKELYAILEKESDMGVIFIEAQAKILKEVILEYFAALIE